MSTICCDLWVGERGRGSWVMDRSVDSAGNGLLGRRYCEQQRTEVAVPSQDGDRSKFPANVIKLIS